MSNTNAIYDEWVLWALIVSVAAILLVALVFAILAIALRFLKIRLDKREQHLRSLWIGPVLDCIEDRRTQPFRHGVRRQDRMLFLEFLGRLALSLSSEEQEAIRSIARPYLYVARSLLSDREAEFRALGVQLLGLLDPVPNRSHLLAGLKDSSPIVSLTAIRSLARTQSEQDVRHIIEVLPRFKGWGITILTSLLVACGARACGPLRELLANPDAGVRMRVAACDALRWLVDMPAVPVAREVLLSDPDREISAACLRLISWLGLNADAEILEKFLTHDDWVLRLYAVSGVANLASPDYGELIAMSIGDPSSWVALRAARGLSEMGRHDLLAHIVDTDHPRAATAKQFLIAEDV